MTVDEAEEMPYLFAGQDLPEGFAISLFRRGDVVHGFRRHSILWTLAFHDRQDRDVLQAWLVERRDRWPIWGAIAAASGAHALSRHLMTMIVTEDD